MSDGKRVIVVGTGYVGLPAALMLARAGHEVVGVDIDENVVTAINDGVLHIDEEQLHSLLDDPAVRENLTASHTTVPGDVFIVAVPTPLQPRDKQADLSAVVAAVRDITSVLEPGNLVIIESTVPPLTCRNVITPLLEASGLKAGTDFQLAHCPERILPGEVFREIVENDRLIGSATVEGREDAADIYRSFVKGSLYLTDDVTAELVKLMENTYRDINIGLANELNAVAANLGVDGREAIALANLHPRVDILSPGIGVGGHCIPIDPWFIHQVDPLNATLIQAARQVNDDVPGRIATTIRRSVAHVTGPLIVAAGASYKPDTSDVRESPAVAIVEELRRDGYQVIHHDPVAGRDAVPRDLVDVARGADLLAILVPHKVFLAELADRRAEIEAAMRTPLILEFS